MAIVKNYAKFSQRHLSENEIRMLNVDKGRCREILEDWSASGESLTNCLRRHGMGRKRFWFLLKSADLAALYRSLQGMWSFNAMDKLLGDAEDKLATSGHAAWGAVLQKQLHAMVDVMAPSLQVLEESPADLPEAVLRIEEIIDLGRERLRRIQELEAAGSIADDAVDCGNAAVDGDNGAVDCVNAAQRTPQDISQADSADQNVHFPAVLPPSVE